MKIVYKKTEELKPYENNARTHSEEQIGQIANSITEFGFTNPILIDAKNGIIAGHGRLEAARLLKMGEVPCVVLDYLTEAQKKALVIADNKIALNAGWNDDILRLELIALKELDFNIKLTGFNEVNLELFDDVEEIDVSLPNSGRSPLATMTFTISREQLEIINNAMGVAKQYPINDPAGVNENQNGNAIFYICEFFLNRAQNG